MSLTRRPSVYDAGFTGSQAFSPEALTENALVIARKAVKEELGFTYTRSSALSASQDELIA